MRGRKIPSTVVRPNFMCPQPERGRNLATPSAEARPKTHPLPKRGRKVPSALGEAVLRQLCCWQPTTKQTQWLRFESCWSPPLGTVSRQQHSLPEHPTGVEPKLEPDRNFHTPAWTVMPQSHALLHSSVFLVLKHLIPGKVRKRALLLPT